MTWLEDPPPWLRPVNFFEEKSASARGYSDPRNDLAPLLRWRRHCTICVILHSKIVHGTVSAECAHGIVTAKYIWQQTNQNPQKVFSRSVLNVPAIKSLYSRVTSVFHTVSHPGILAVQLSSTNTQKCIETSLTTAHTESADPCRSKSDQDDGLGGLFTGDFRVKIYICGKIFMKIWPVFREIRAKLRENALPCNVEESLKIADPDQEATDFQNLISSFLSTDSSVVQFSRRTDQ